jgi:hypothetical protein
MTIERAPLGWVPQACTLPTADQPLRQAEFDALFATALRAFDRPDPTRLRLTLSGGPDLAAGVRDLTVRESECCSFFGFEVTSRDDDLLDLEVTVPGSQIEVLDAITARAAKYQLPS